MPDHKPYSRRPKRYKHRTANNVQGLSRLLHDKPVMHKNSAEHETDGSDYEAEIVQHIFSDSWPKSCDKRARLVLRSYEVIHIHVIDIQYMKGGFRIPFFHLPSTAAPGIKACICRGFNHYNFRAAIRVLTAVTLTYVHGHEGPPINIHAKRREGGRNGFIICRKSYWGASWPMRTRPSNQNTHPRIWCSISLKTLAIRSERSVAQIMKRMESEIYCRTASRTSGIGKRNTCAAHM
jgi:hypothetical protein